MDNNLIHDRGRGPELVGTRITVYNLLPYFLDPTVTEEYVCGIYELTPEQVAAARAYVFENFEEVMRIHRQFEARLNQANPPEVTDQLAKSNFAAQFREWQAARTSAKNGSSKSGNSDPFPSFHEWMRANR